MPVEKVINIHSAEFDDPPALGSLVVAWRADYPVVYQCVYKRRKRGEPPAFYDGHITRRPDYWVNVADLADPEGVAAVLERWKGNGLA